jgi:hypothetical protein
VALSRAALEVLAIVAYRQPIARSGIEFIRGSSSDLDTLLQRGLIEHNPHHLLVTTSLGGQRWTLRGRVSRVQWLQPAGLERAWQGTRKRFVPGCGSIVTRPPIRHDHRDRLDDIVLTGLQADGV